MQSCYNLRTSLSMMLTVAFRGSIVVLFGSTIVTEAGMRVKVAKKYSDSSTSISSMIVTLKHCFGCIVLNVARVYITLMKSAPEPTVPEPVIPNPTVPEPTMSPVSAVPAVYRCV